MISVINILDLCFNFSTTALCRAQTDLARQARDEGLDWRRPKHSHMRLLGFYIWTITDRNKDIAVLSGFHVTPTLPWFSYQIRKIAGCVCTGNAEIVFPANGSKRSRHASRHMRNARATMHVGIANKRFPLKSVAGKTFPAFPAHAQHAILRIW